ncbi:MAG: hypothetical protein TR69_WS6001001165 [candidate division WS6 bacterium OLB20]|uniref:Uncharacterized protein n=1 Tax=candidate division WS6 bacterium OLB20 TaxID=1617426 RepID=A0A136LWY1_9BACT|nr:MAG: hypothetical protein TR69_WS6001001165 [candidate division WS6 bacterium OLB20]
MAADTSADEIIRLQIPMRKTIKDKANDRAKEYGFGSIQEVVRLFVAGFVRGEYEIGFTAKKNDDKKN